MVPSRIRSAARSAWGMAMLAYGLARLTGAVAINTGKRTLGMTKPSSTKELDEALDAAFDLAIAIKKSMAPGGPGGKQITLDEILSTVTDGSLKESVVALVDAIEGLIRGERLDLFALIPTVTDALLDFMGTLRDALADRRVSPDEILHSVTTGDVRPELKKAIEGAAKIPDELSGLDMWKMMSLMQRVAGRLPELMAKM